MNTHTVDDRQLLTTDHPVANSTLTRSRPPNLIDRLALRAGMALIVWGRRGDYSPLDRPELIRRYCERAAREDRERSHERSRSLTIPRV